MLISTPNIVFTFISCYFHCFHYQISFDELKYLAKLDDHILFGYQVCTCIRYTIKWLLFCMHCFIATRPVSDQFVNNSGSKWQSCDQSNQFSCPSSISTQDHVVLLSPSDGLYKCDTVYNNIINNEIIIVVIMIIIIIIHSGGQRGWCCSCDGCSGEKYCFVIHC